MVFWWNDGDMVIKQEGQLVRPARLPNGLIHFKEGSGEDRCVLDGFTALSNGADMLWIKTEKPYLSQIDGMINRTREVIPNARLLYNNSPSFNWTLNFRQQVFDAWSEEGKANTMNQF